jgi:hypothetical protein
MKKLITSLLTSFYLLFPLNSQENITFSSNKWILPNFEISYIRNKDRSNLEGKLDGLIEFRYNEIKSSENYIDIYERFNEFSTNYIFKKDNFSVKVIFENNSGETGFMEEDLSAISVNSLINKFLDGNAGEGMYKVMVGEEFYNIQVNKIEDNDSSVVYQVPLGYEPLNIEQAIVTLKKNGNKLDPSEIFIDFPWYFSFLDYKLEKMSKLYK